MIRTIVERLSRNRILKRRLPAFFDRTPVYVSPDAQLKYLKLSFDDDLLRVASSYLESESVVWDIGANVGIFTFAAASIAKSGSVLAVEADIWLAQLIRKSRALPENQKLNVQVLPTAISDSNGLATFIIAARGRASNSLEASSSRSLEYGVREKVLVPTFTLDTLLQHCQPPTFVKIDVEGAELKVLQGAARLLSDVRPLIYIEVGADVAESVSALLHQANYVLFDGSVPLSQKHQLLQCSFNTLAIPGEHTLLSTLNGNLTSNH